MAPKFKKLFGRKDDGYYDGPDLFSSVQLPSHDPLTRRFQRNEGPSGPFWQEIEPVPPPPIVPTRPTSSYDKQTVTLPRERFDIASGYKKGHDQPLRSLSLSQDQTSPPSTSSSGRPTSSQRRAQHIDLLHAATSAHQPNSPMSYHTSRTSQYNEEIAVRNAQNAVPIKNFVALGSPSDFAKYQEHVADRNMRSELGYRDFCNGMQQLNCPSGISSNVETESLDNRRVSSDRPGTAYSCGNMYQPQQPVPQNIGKNSTQDSREKPRGNVPSFHLKYARALHRQPKFPALREQKSLPHMAAKISVNDTKVEAVGVAISTDRTWNHHHPNLSGRNSSRKVLDLTNENGEEVMKEAETPSAQEEKSITSDINMQLETKSSSGGQKLGQTNQNFRFLPVSVYNRRARACTLTSEDENTTAHPDESRGQHALADSADLVAQSGHSDRPPATAREDEPAKHFLQQPFHRSVDDIPIAPTVPLKPRPRNNSTERSPDVYDNTLNTASSSTPNIRRHRSVTDPSVLLTTDFSSDGRKITLYSTRSHPSLIHSRSHSDSIGFLYAPEGSLYRDNTLVLPGLDHSSTEDEWRTLHCDEGSLLPSAAMFDKIIQSFESGDVHHRKVAIGGLGKGTFTVPPYRVPKRDSSLKAALGS